MMEAVPFVPEWHFEEICGWIRKRAMNPLPVSAYPKKGWIVPDYAAAFLYQTDSSVAFIENLLANPDREKTETHPAIDQCLKQLESFAKGQGFKVLWGSVALPHILSGAKLRGFGIKPDQYLVITKRLDP